MLNNRVSEGELVHQLIRSSKQEDARLGGPEANSPLIYIIRLQKEEKKREDTFSPDILELNWTWNTINMFLFAWWAFDGRQVVCCTATHPSFCPEYLQCCLFSEHIKNMTNSTNIRPQTAETYIKVKQTKKKLWKMFS